MSFRNVIKCYSEKNIYTIIFANTVRFYKDIYIKDIIITTMPSIFIEIN